MSRPRTELTSAQDADLRARTARGESAQTIFHALHGAISVKTIARRQQDLRAGKPNVGKQSSAPVDPPDVPEDVPENTPAADLDRWIARLEVGAKKAEADGNLAALASIAAKVTALMALRHKSQPLPKADPNESPDMAALGEQVSKRFFALIDELFTP